MSKQDPQASGDASLSDIFASLFEWVAEWVAEEDYDTEDE